jgi:hypothetical protein
MASAPATRPRPQPDRLRSPRKCRPSLAPAQVELAGRLRGPGRQPPGREAPPRASHHWAGRQGLGSRRAGTVRLNHYSRVVASTAAWSCLRTDKKKYDCTQPPHAEMTKLLYRWVGLLLNRSTASGIEAQLGWFAVDSEAQQGRAPHHHGIRRTSDQGSSYSPAGPATTVFKRILLLLCLSRGIFLEPAEAPNSRKAAFAQPFAGSHHVSIAPLGPPAVVRFRVLQRTEPLLGPASPKGRVALRVEWRIG